MSGEAIAFLSLAFFWLVYLLRPFVAREAEGAPDERRRLVETKRGLLLALRDAELDRESGKLSDGDHAAIVARLEARAADVIRALDTLGGGSPEARIERELERLRAARGGG